MVKGAHSETPEPRRGAVAKRYCRGGGERPATFVLDPESFGNPVGKMFHNNKPDQQPDAPASFVCPRCRFTSYNPHDIAHRYCGRCHAFADDAWPMLPESK